MLGIDNLPHGLTNHAKGIVVVHQSFTVQPVLFKPAELFAGRTVCPYGLPVAADGAVDEPVGVIDERIGTLKAASTGC